MISMADLVRPAAEFLRKRQYEVLDMATLGGSLLAINYFVASVTPAIAGFVLLLAALIPIPSVNAIPKPRNAVSNAALRKVAIVVLLGCVMHFGLDRPLASLWFGAIWVLFPLLYTPILYIFLLFMRFLPPVSRRARDLGMRILGGPRRSESIRCALLAIGTIWLMRGFARPTLSGGTDALWYGTMLADVVAQVRAGIFPIWVGQSIYQFNGAIYPVRVAPAFHYLGAGLDFLTFHKLGIFALQNLLLIVLGICATASAYICLGKLLSDRRWLAMGLTAIFMSCPGVLGIAFNTDLYMSWTTLPTLPIIWFAMVRSFQDGGTVKSLVILGAALGLSWWGHSPIALWSTMLAFAAQLSRLIYQKWSLASLMAIVASAGVFAVVSAYPIGSVLWFPPEAGVHGASFQKASPEAIVQFLRQVFPATFLPLTPIARSLGDFQLGYALWSLLLLLLWSWRRDSRGAATVAIASALFLAFMLLPIPWLDLQLWSAVPSLIRDTTGNWVMNRLYLLFAAAIVFGTAASVSARGLQGRSMKRAVSIIVSTGCIWSLFEARKFGVGSEASRRPPDSAVDLLRPENIQLTRYSYIVFPKLPSTFTHGVADPYMENHLLSKDTLAPVSSNADAARNSGRIRASGVFTAENWKSFGYVSLNRTLHIDENHSYLLSFDFLHPETTGTLEIVGPHFFRAYQLPEHGGDKAFGAGGEHSTTLSVWTTAGPQDLSLRFYPIPLPPPDVPGPDVGRVALLEFERTTLPVQVESWIPYRARVQSGTEAWLETPRVYQTGYVATVDQAAAIIRKSADGLVCVAVPKGASTVVLRYVAPTGLQILFWISAISIVGFLCTLCIYCLYGICTLRLFAPFGTRGSA
jgi:hypothetical protein